MQTKLICQSTDTIVVSKTDTIIKHVPIVYPDSLFRFNTKIPQPKRAALFSALLPGLGQWYNKQYFKTGVVVGGYAVLSYFIISNRQEYLSYQKEYIRRINDPNNNKGTHEFPDYSFEDVKNLRSGFRKYYEYSVIAASLGYLLNILDAYTSAHLKTFDMSKNISLHWRVPAPQPIGLSLTYNFSYK